MYSGVATAPWAAQRLFSKAAWLWSCDYATKHVRLKTLISSWNIPARTCSPNLMGCHHLSARNLFIEALICISCINAAALRVKEWVPLRLLGASAQLIG